MKLSEILRRALKHIRRKRREGKPLHPKAAAGAHDIQEEGDSPPPEIGELEEYLFFQRWIKVVSSNVDLIAYNADDRRLSIQFKNGAVYTYEGITIGEAEDFAFSTSKGKWVWAHLRRNQKGGRARRGEKATVVYAFTVSRRPRRRPPRRMYGFTAERTTAIREVARTEFLRKTRAKWHKRRDELRQEVFKAKYA